MRLEYQEGEGVDGVVIVLSRRNLRALLAKLEQPGSLRELSKELTPGSWVSVRSEDDEEHYEGRTPGPIWDETEKIMEEDGYGK